MTEMSKAEIREFLMHGTFTGKLATVRKEGAYVVPIWFVVDNGNSKIYAANLMTYCPSLYPMIPVSG